MRRRPALVALLLPLLAAIAGANEPAVVPLDQAHAHNDYWHERPLFDALDRGFTSVEADVLLVDGKLLVGHEPAELKPERTLESLYLAPLAERVRQNGGEVYPNGRRFLLLVDIKSDAQETYAVLQEALAQYADMLTTVEHGKVRPGVVTVVISGNRPTEALAAAEVRFAGWDGRVTDLASGAPAHLMPMISDNWSNHFTWIGNGPLPDSERAKLNEIVRRAHGAGRIVRFWATPENEAVWRELRAAGVDLIGTDELDRLAKFLRAEDGAD
jgi:glycerophosphoryl diester phosphodiesterase